MPREEIGQGYIDFEFDQARVRRETADVQRQLARARLQAPLRLRVDQALLRRGVRSAVAPLSQDAWRSFRTTGLQSLREIERQGAVTAGRLEALFRRTGLTFRQALGAGTLGQIGQGVGTALSVGGIAGISQQITQSVVSAIQRRFGEARQAGGGVGTAALFAVGATRTAFGAFNRSIGAQTQAVQQITGTTRQVASSMREYLAEVRQTASFAERTTPEMQSLNRNVAAAGGAGSGLLGALDRLVDNIEATGIFGAEDQRGAQERQAQRTQAQFESDQTLVQQRILRGAQRQLQELTARNQLLETSNQFEQRYLQTQTDILRAQDRAAADAAFVQLRSVSFDERGRPNFPERLRVAQERLVNETLNQAAQLDVQTALLRGNTAIGRNYAAAFREQVQAQQDLARETDRQTLLARTQGRGITGGLERIAGGPVNTALTNLTNAAFGIATGIGIFGVAIGAAAAGLSRLARAAERTAAAQFAAANLASRRGVDVSALTEGIRTATAGGLTDLQIYRTALNALRTESRDIFGNIEEVLVNLRVVASATGIELEDATNRFFLGIRKNEPELLDELGIILRLQVAYDNYARQLNVATSELTPYQQRLAVAAEAQRQLNRTAEEFGGAVVLQTQEATEAVDRLSASWSRFADNLGEAARGPVALAADAIISAGNLFFDVSRGLVGGDAALGPRERQPPDIPQLSEAARLVQEQNRDLQERLGLLTKQTISGNLNIRQQRQLLLLQRDITAQTQRQGPIRGLTQRDFEGIATNRQELTGNLRNLREGRERSRIASIQAPLLALLSSLEGGGEVARLSAAAYENLTRNTSDSNNAILLAATLFGSTEEAVRGYIEVYQQETDTKDDNSRAAREAAEAWRALTGQIERANRFGILMTQTTQTIGEALRASTLSFRPLIDDLGEFGSAANQADRFITGGAGSPFQVGEGVDDNTFNREIRNAERVFDLRRQAALAEDLTLTSGERFADYAAQFGLDLETVESAFGSFVEGFAIRGDSFIDLLGRLLQDLGRAAVRRVSGNLIEQLIPLVGGSVAGGQPAPITIQAFNTEGAAAVFQGILDGNQSRTQYQILDNTSREIY